jgi:tetratricopeptide (TPR) repeat protein
VWLKNPDKAAAAFRRATGLLEPLVEQFPENAEMRAELATAYLVAPPEALPNDPEPVLRRAIDLAAGSPWLVATAQVRLGMARKKAGDLTGAESAYRAAVELFAAVAPANRPTPGHLELAFTRMCLAEILKEQGNLRSARKVLEESVASLRPPADQTDGRFRPEREWLGMTYLALAGVCDDLKDRAAAKQANENAEKCFGPGGPGGPWGGWGGWGGGRKKDGPPRKDGPKG